MVKYTRMWFIVEVLASQQGGGWLSRSTTCMLSMPNIGIQLTLWTRPESCYVGILRKVIKINATKFKKTKNNPTLTCTLLAKYFQHCFTCVPSTK